MSRAATAFLAAAMTGLSACASAGRGALTAAWVEAEGWAPVVAGDAEGGRRRALLDAQRRAVEKGAGVRVAAATVVENAVNLRQRLHSELDGYVERLETLGQAEEGGFHKIRIRALVRRGDATAAQAAPPAGQNRLAVEFSGPAGAGLRRGLMERGFTLERGGAAEFIVRGASSARPVRDRRLGDFRSSRARVDVEIVESATGLVVASAADESAALGHDAAAAEEAASQAAGETAGRRAAAGLAALLWKRL